MVGIAIIRAARVCWANVMISAFFNALLIICLGSGIGEARDPGVHASQKVHDEADPKVGKTPVVSAV